MLTILEILNVFGSREFLLAAMMSSIFPLSILAYQLFLRDKQLEELRREFKLLGIDNSISEDKFKKSYSSISFLLQILLPIALTSFGVKILFADSRTEIQGITDPTLVLFAMRYGFLGAYLYSIQLIYRRYTTFDLQPAVYMNASLTMIAGFAFNFTAFIAISNLVDKAQPKGIEGGMYAIIAFSFGYFPLLAIRWFNQITANVLGTKDPSQIVSLPLSVIDGISQFHETRLRDEGIDNVQNLASAKIDELLINTRFNAQQVLEWIDQAILHTYVNPGSMESFRRGGVRKISDFQDIWEPYFFEPMIKNKGNRQVVKPQPEGLHEARKNRALQLQSTPEYLDSLYQTSLAGPNIDYIRNYWPNQRELIKRLSETAVEDVKSEAKPNVVKSLIKIFEEIGNLEINDDGRPKLGGIAKILAPDPSKFVSEKDLLTQSPKGLLGLAWWLWWLDINDETKDFTSQAKTYYEKAITDSSDNPIFSFETSVFYLLQTDDYEMAKTHAEQAIKLSEGKDENGLLSNALALLVLINKKSGSSKNGQQPVVEAINQLVEASNDSNGEGSTFEYLQEIPQKISEAFNDDSLPIDGSELQNKISFVLEGGSNGDD